MLTLLQRYIDTEYEWDSRPSSATEIRRIKAGTFPYYVEKRGLLYYVDKDRPAQTTGNPLADRVLRAIRG